MVRSDAPLAAFFRRRPLPWVLVTAVFFLGTVAGFLAAGGVDPEGRDRLSRYVEQVTGQLPVGPERGTLARTASVEYVLGTVGLMWLLGLSLIGAPLIVALLFIRGFALGFTSGFLWEERALEGLALTLTGVVPHHLFMVPATLLAGGAALSFSAVATAIILGRRQLSAFRQFALSTTLCALSALLFVAGVLVEAYITPVLLQAAGNYLGLH